VPYFFYQAPDLPVRTLCVVGDSVTAGLDDGEDTWPKQLSRRLSTSVVDASQPGATLKSARQQVELLNQQGGDVLLLEIGGNDLLEGLPIAVFERDMDQLLQACRRSGRSTVMFELPLPPLAMRYVAIQRRLARQHQVTLIPRRRFLQVLTAPQSTVDGIHLSMKGQTRTADLVQNLLKFPEGAEMGAGAYRHFEPVH
jgi:acyl-CoA thioesterase-1